MRRSIVDAAGQCDKSLRGTKLIELRFALYQQRHGMFVRVKCLLSASLIAEVGCNLAPVPEPKNEEGRQTRQECGPKVENDGSCAHESGQPDRPAFRLLVRRQNSKGCRNKQARKRCPLAE